MNAYNYDGTEQGLSAFMGEATNEQDWNSRCDHVKSRHNGYPHFWFMTVVLSGLLDRTRANWGKPVTLTVTEAAPAHQPELKGVTWGSDGKPTFDERIFTSSILCTLMTSVMLPDWKGEFDAQFSAWGRKTVIGGVNALVEQWGEYNGNVAEFFPLITNTCEAIRKLRAFLEAEGTPVFTPEAIGVEVAKLTPLLEGVRTNNPAMFDPASVEASVQSIIKYAQNPQKETVLDEVSATGSVILANEISSVLGERVMTQERFDEFMLAMGSMFETDAYENAMIDLELDEILSGVVGLDDLPN